ncbi:hypothetical protein F1D05_33435 [Kribbella qitaiheensis]|uniref:Pycsar effector protein domain-containing protein n=1 Tax=Kribbella qitaiheensis TaxID=1544730 RepID=A0A7G6X6R0_9ACTN|nr:Pycsar system effector family protein [Kribbella qitaiheensis]QNE21925.1 hypothetical protein F1D05_33435 [Kribbella qitaiheensis]
MTHPFPAKPKLITKTSPLDLAWRAHDAAAASIGKADTKAGFVATLDTAVLAGVLAIADKSSSPKAFQVLTGLGAGCLVLAVLFAVTVVLPILRVRQTRRHAAGNWLYFGAVRHHSATELADRLTGEDPLRGVCAQTVTLARLAWLKHRLLQASLLATVAGIALFLTALIAGGTR